MAFDEKEIQRTVRAVNAFLDRKRPPPEIRDELDLAYRIDGQSVELFEVRPAWRGAPGETIEIPIAKTTYVRRHDHWRVYWQRADLRWHRYDPDPEVTTIEAFLDLVERDAYACFFG